MEKEIGKIPYRREKEKKIRARERKVRNEEKKDKGVNRNI